MNTISRTNANQPTMRSMQNSVRARNIQPGTLDDDTGDDRNMNYHSFPDPPTTPESSASTNYRGFSTPFMGMFADPDHERVDCCALACCGIIQADRDRFLVTGTRPPSCFKRIWMHLVLPIVIFLLAVYCAFHILDPLINSLASTTCVFCMIGYFITQCLKGTMKRRQVRKDLLWNRYHLLTSGEINPRTDDDSIEEELANTPPVYFMGQTMADIRTAHMPCGCYATDRGPNDGSRDESNQWESPTLCRRFFQIYDDACCSKLCGMNLQLCGLCAVAQEAREVESMLDSEYTRIDYVTMQPMIEYYPAIYEARTSETATSSGWNRLSDFSKWVVKVCAFFLILLFFWSLLSFRLHHNFGLGNFLVFCATILQAFLLLVIVYWNHSKDVSVDALIKFFACGFCLSTTLAVFFELLVGLVMRFVMKILIAMSGIDAVSDNEFTSILQGGMSGFGDFWFLMQDESGGTPSYRQFLQVFGEEHPFIYTVYLFLNAFFLAAMIEELAKYFGFRMVEHPDFFSRREVEEMAEVNNNSDDGDVESRELAEFPEQNRSFISRGAAITVSMVAVSLGFACCENLIYIFVYGEATVAVQVVVLIARSLFPIHPLAAALQSVRVCARNLENDKRMRVGRVIFPALLFHGLYDFFLMWIDFVLRSRGKDVDDDAVLEDVNSDLYSIIASFLILCLGMVGYFRQSKKQRQRLQALDGQISVDQARLI